MSIESPTTAAPVRIASIDAYRGFVMCLMMGEVVPFRHLAKSYPDNPLWMWLAHHQTHVEWRGCTLHDLIQPSFSFLVGAALPFSLANRRARGESTGVSILHAAWRSLILILLGVFLRSTGRSQTNYTFEDTLSQIGLGYLPLFLIALLPRRAYWAALLVVLVGYWTAFGLFPLPGPDFDYGSAGVTAAWPENAAGLAAHWNKNTNLAWAFDRWFLNLLPREKPFLNNGGGYSTLSFIPTLGTMILGLIAGSWLRDGRPHSRTLCLMLGAGLIGLATGYAADRLGVCPVVKRIWTPSWVLFSGGWCFLLLAGFYAVCDAAGYKAWSLPLRVVGANSIAAYLMAHLIHGFVIDSFHTHLGRDIFRSFGDVHEPVVAGLVVFAVYWLVLFWMYRRRIFLRI